VLYRLFATIGFQWAIRRRAAGDLPKLRAALVALAKPGIQLSNEAYRIADSYETETIRSEHERDSLKLRAKYAKRCAEVGLVQCARVLGQSLDSELQEIAEREGLFGVVPRKTRFEPETKNDEVGT
jgi:hypothetical protein